MATLSKNWSIMRLLRLGMGGVIIVISVQERQPLFALIGGLFIAQAAFNVRCIDGNCAVPNTTAARRFDAAETVTFEEIK